jgi:hypothetical protein
MGYVKTHEVYSKTWLSFLFNGTHMGESARGQGHGERGAQSTLKATSGARMGPFRCVRSEVAAQLHALQ